ncbi:unnamed protein product, partial [marine sediment metagenome]
IGSNGERIQVSCGNNKPQPRFKSGDKVLTIANNSGFNNLIGEIVEVSRFTFTDNYEEYIYCYNVKIKDDFTTMEYDEYNLKLYEEENKDMKSENKQPKFKVGDKTESVRGGMHGVVTGVINHDNGDGFGYNVLVSKSKYQKDFNFPFREEAVINRKFSIQELEEGKIYKADESNGNLIQKDMIFKMIDSKLHFKAKIKHKQWNTSGMTFNTAMRIKFVEIEEEITVESEINKQLEDKPRQSFYEIPAGMTMDDVEEKKLIFEKDLNKALEELDKKYKLVLREED